METPDDRPQDLRIGTPERAAAEDALETHLAAERLDAAEYESRVAACQQARTRSELLRIFADLPSPHPALPPVTDPPVAPDDDDELPPAGFMAGCLTLALGLPVAVVLGIVYGAWWTLAVPVAVTVAMAYVEHLRSARRGSAGPGDQGGSAL